MYTVHAFILISTLLVASSHGKGGVASASGGAAAAAGGAATAAEGAAGGALSGLGSELMGQLGEVGTQFLTSLATKLGTYLMDNLLGDHPFDVILGRGVRISASGNVATIQDVATGIAVTGTGATQQEAFSSATQNFIKTLLNMGFISVHDLHLAPVIATTKQPCGNAYPDDYCEDQKAMGMCSPRSVFASFMSENCSGTCKGC